MPATTAATNCTLLPEWAPQSGVMLTWPRSDGDWSPDYSAVEQCHARIAAGISRFELVLVACMNASHARRIGRLVAAAGGYPERLRCYIAPANDAWSRDHGPLTVATDHGLRLLDFRFNGWGGKYPSDLDNALTRNLARQGAFGGIPLTTVDFVLEGGSIEVDGHGTLLTSASCLLTATRNPGYDREDITAALSRWLGIRRVLWLETGHIEGDDTDGHIDTLARFCDPGTIVYQACDDRADSHYDTLKEMAAELSAFRQANGDRYRLVPLPWPREIRDASGRRLPATYANFLIVNGAVLVPTYDDPADAEAIARLERCFPERPIMGVPCRPLIHQYGSLHCVTMQLPAGVLL